MQLWRDFRFGLRSLIKSPGFTLISVLALALGVGPNTALFSVVYSAFFDSQGYPDADRLVVVYHHPKGADDTRRTAVAVGDFLEYQRQNTVFESLSASKGGGGRFGDGEKAEIIGGELVTPGHVTKTLGLRPMLGRDFLPEETEPGKDHVVILAYRFWESHFPNDPGIVGRPIRISGEQYTVVGVMPPSQDFNSRNKIQIWTPQPITPKDAQTHGSQGGRLMGRLKPGVTMTQARSDMNRIARDLSALYPATNGSLDVVIEPFRGNWVPATTRTTLWLLAGTVSFVLLIACANLASLMIARGTARRREMAVRMSLGASPRQLFAQLFIETLPVSLAGCVLGTALGWALLRLLVVQMPAVTAFAEKEPALNLPILLFTAAIAVVAGVVFGSIPLWRASSRNMDEALKAGAPASAGRSRVRLRRFLVIFEFAAAMTLLAAAAICANSLWQKTRGDIGIQALDKILVFNLRWPQNIRQNAPVPRDAFYAEAMTALLAIPGVRQATLFDGSPLSAGSNFPFEIVGQPVANRDARSRTYVHAVGRGYFGTLGIPIVRGRAIEDFDGRESEPVAMVNEEFARRFLRDTEVLDQYLVMELPSEKGWLPIRHRIVGVYRNVRRSGPADRNEPEITIPGSQGFSIAITIAVLTAGDPLDLRGPITQSMLALNTDYPITNVATLDQMAADLVARERGYAIVFGLLAGLALLLSGVGIYGVMAFLVAQRTKEIGVRMALGATRQRVVAMVFNEGMLLAAAGLCIGLLGASSVSSALQSVLGDAKVLNYGVFGAAAAVLLLCAAVACGLPALRASEIDPISSLRSE